MIGQTLDHYRIESKLGEGGMGVVFRALDTHLDRQVAVKVLPPEAVANPERKRRFVQEAKAASALNHPNIIHVYDIDTAAPQGHPVDFIAMEFVEGQTLHDCISRKGFPIREALKYAAEIADALAAAHAAGIIHRDIKPGNIMVTSPASGRPGLVKILDFGLAKLSEPDGSDDAAPTQTVGPRTEDGAIVGTAAYMSPEQAEGKKVDARTDVFSFGAVLYEMVTGQRAFQGDTRISTLSAILHKEPTPLRKIVEGAPPDLERLIAYCLRKDPSQRLHSMDDVRLLLEAVREAEQQPPVPVEPARRSWLWRILVASASLLAGAALVLAWLPSRGPDLSSYRLTPFVTEAGQENAPAWSPDGKTLAYAAEVGGVLQIHTRSLDAPAGTRVTSSSSTCDFPFWSPDGSRIYYVSRADLWWVGAAGGVPQLAVKNVNAASLSPDGRTLVFSRGARGAGGLWIVSPPEAEPRLYRQAPFPEQGITAGHPQFSPDRSKIGIAISGPEDAAEPELWILPYPAGTPKRAVARARLPKVDLSLSRAFSWMPDSRHIVVGGQIDHNDRHLYMLDTQTNAIQPLTSTTNRESAPAVSRDGRIAFASGADDYDVVEIGLDGSGPRTLLATSRSEHSPAWSPSGGQYAYVTNANLASEIWLRSGQEGSARPLVRLGSGFPPWTALRRVQFSPDGRRIAYDIYGSKHVIAVSSIAGGEPVVLDQESTEQHASSWSHDGNWIAYQRLNRAKAKYELVKIPLGGGKPVPICEKPSADETAWSPSGEWICHFWEDKLRLTSVDGEAHKLLDSPGTAAVGFSRDGTTLYAVRRNAAQKWELAAFGLPDGREKKVTPLNLPLSVTISGFSLHPDGKSFATSVATARYDIWLLEGFPQPRRWSFLR
jgi:Tol biopolymer transport system component